MPKERLPDRWEDYSNVGEVIPCTRLVTFKVPLDEHLSRRYPEKLWFTPDTLLEIAESRDIDIGMIIDLTFTTRYYRASRFTDKGILYEKIFVPGHVIPNDAIMNKFFFAIDQFLADNADNDKVIGVHCTHGVNRTGYVVCRYMIERLGFKPAYAIEAYGLARGYPIERENYLEDLKQRPKAPDQDNEAAGKTEICETSHVNDRSVRRKFQSEQDDFIPNKIQRTAHHTFSQNGYNKSVGYQSERLGNHMNSYSHNQSEHSWNQQGRPKFRGGYQSRDYNYQKGYSNYRPGREGNQSNFGQNNYQTGNQHYPSRRGGSQYGSYGYQSNYMNSQSKSDGYRSYGYMNSQSESDRYQSYGRNYQTNQNPYRWSKNDSFVSSNFQSHSGPPAGRKRKL